MGGWAGCKGGKQKQGDAFIIHAGEMQHASLWWHNQRCRRAHQHSPPLLPFFTPDQVERLSAQLRERGGTLAAASAQLELAKADARKLAVVHARGEGLACLRVAGQDVGNGAMYCFAACPLREINLRRLEF